MDHRTLQRLIKSHGTPLVVVDHKVLRENYAHFRKHLPRVQVYFAVKANSDPAIVKTFYEVGSSFDVAPSHPLQIFAASRRTVASLLVSRRWYAASISPRSLSAMCAQ